VVFGVGVPRRELVATMPAADPPPAPSDQRAVIEVMELVEAPLYSVEREDGQLTPLLEPEVSSARTDAQVVRPEPAASSARGVRIARTESRVVVEDTRAEPERITGAEISIAPVRTASAGAGASSSSGAEVVAAMSAGAEVVDSTSGPETRSSTLTAARAPAQPERRPERELREVESARPLQSAVAINPDDVDVGGGLTRTRCAAALQKPLAMFRLCLADLGPRGSSHELRVRGRIGGDGLLRIISVGGDESGELSRCVQREFMHARMPRPDTGEAELTFRLRLR
jgi:hypothetical protein